MKRLEAAWLARRINDCLLPTRCFDGPARDIVVVAVAVAVVVSQRLDKVGLLGTWGSRVRGGGCNDEMRGAVVKRCE